MYVINTAGFNNKDKIKISKDISYQNYMMSFY